MVKRLGCIVAALGAVVFVLTIIAGGGRAPALVPFDSTQEAGA